MDDLTAEFINETTDALQALKPGVDRLAHTPGDAAVLADIYKIFHTMKGACGFLPLPRLEKIAEAGEGLLTRLQQGTQTANDATTYVIKATLARVADVMIALAEAGIEPKGEDSDVLQQLRGTNPVVKQPEPVVVAPAPVVETPKPAEAPAVHAAVPAAAAETGLRVTRESLDELLRITGDLVHARNQLLHLARLRDDREMAAPLQQLSHITTQLHDRVLQTRVQPMPNGVTARIKVPRTLSISSVLLVEAAGEAFALPHADMEELIATGGPTPEHRIETIGGAEVVRLNGSLLPLVRLSALMQLPQGRVGAREYVAVLRVQNRRLGLVIDQALDTQEVVIKPLSYALSGLSMYQGSTMLGDGRILLVLSPAGLAAELGDALPEVVEEEETGERLSDATSFLIFTAGRGGPKAVPLAQVVRLEIIDSATIERSGDEFVAPYRDGALTLKTLPDTYIPARGTFEAIVFGEGDDAIGLVTDAVMDIVFAPAGLKLTPNTGIYFATAVMNGKSTDILQLSEIIPGMEEVTA